MTAAQFLNRYNPSKTVECALSNAIKAAVQHNKFYIAENAPRAIIRDFWRQQLLALQAVYKQQQEIDQYNADILNLRAILNNQFPLFTDCRISHAQKSIGVFLKHLWCMKLVAIPPSCPVDARILKVAGAAYPATNWGYVNTIEDHKAKVALLMADKNVAAPHVKIAEWELAAYN